MGTAVILAVAAFVFVPRRDPADRPAFLLSLLPLVAVLLQGAAYWWLASRWAVTGRMGPRTAATYRAFRALDPLLWTACLLGVVLLGPSGGAAALCGIALLFGAVEYLNYYVVRLSYPWAEWLGGVGRLSTPRLVRDLRTSRRPDARPAP